MVVVYRENNQILRQVKEAIRISQISHVMIQDQGIYSLSNIYSSLFTTRNQSSGKQSKSHDITRSRSFLSDDVSH